MATITPDWEENQTGVDFDDTSPADTVTAEADIDLATNGYDLVAAQISWAWDASATDYITILVYADVNSGSSVDTLPIYTERVYADAGNTTKRSIIIEGVPYATIEFENQSNQEITSLDLIYAGRKWSSV